MTEQKRRYHVIKTRTQQEFDDYTKARQEFEAKERIRIAEDMRQAEEIMKLNKKIKKMKHRKGFGPNIFAEKRKTK